MLKMISGVVLAGAVAMASTVAMAQGSNTMPGGGAQMNNAPSGDATGPLTRSRSFLVPRTTSIPESSHGRSSPTHVVPSRVSSASPTITCRVDRHQHGRRDADSR